LRLNGFAFLRLQAFSPLAISEEIARSFDHFRGKQRNGPK